MAVALPGVLGVGQAHAALPSNCDQSGLNVSCQFASTGSPDQPFTVPAGVSSVDVVAVGGTGGASGPRVPSPVLGGAGALVKGTLAVTGGQTLLVQVGGSGDDGFDTSAGGFNGGGTGDLRRNSGPGGGGGGGASDVRAAPVSAGLSPDPRLVVAGGGGGAGAPTAIGGGLPGYYHGGPGGDAGQPGALGSFPCFSGTGGAGAPGTATAGGAGGAGGDGGCDPGETVGQKGGDGTLGIGGGGNTATGVGGGGGGGGLYGGGQGGQGVFDPRYGLFDGTGGGGGGGSSLVPAGGSLASTRQAPSVTISYTVAGSCLGRPATIVAPAGGGIVRGTPGDDVIVGSQSADRIASGGGNDRVCSLGGADQVATGAGDDRIDLGSGRDRVDCGSGRDHVQRDRTDRLRGCERVRRR